MVPQLAPEQPDPVTLQTTPWLIAVELLPIGADNVALNCCTELIATVGLGDEIVTAIGNAGNIDGLSTIAALLPPHAVNAATQETSTITSRLNPRYRRFIAAFYARGSWATTQLERWNHVANLR